MPPPGPVAAYANRTSGPAFGYAPKRPTSLSDFNEKILSAIARGATFLPYLDPYTQETQAIKDRYRVMMRSPFVKASMLGKIWAVCSQDLQTVAVSDSPRDKDVADFSLYAYQDAMAGGFRQLGEAVLLPLLIDGSQIGEKVKFADPWPRGKWRGKTFIRTIKAKDTKDTRIVQDDFGNVTAIRGRNADGAYEEFTDLKDFVVSKRLAMFDGPGSSDLRAAAHAWWKLETLETLWDILLGKFTSPYVVATTPPNTDRELNAEIDQSLQDARGNGWLRVPHETQIELMNFVLAGGDFKLRCDGLREQIVLSITGGILQMMVSSQSGQIRGDSSNHVENSQLFTWELGSLLMSICNSQITPGLVDDNFTDADYPKLTLGSINYADMLQAIGIDEAAQRMGAPLSKKALGRKYGLQFASDPSDLLTAPIAPQIPGQPPGDPGLFPTGQRAQ